MKKTILILAIAFASFSGADAMNVPVPSATQNPATKFVTESQLRIEIDNLKCKMDCLKDKINELTFSLEEKIRANFETLNKIIEDRYIDILNRIAERLTDRLNVSYQIPSSIVYCPSQRLMQSAFQQPYLTM